MFTARYEMARLNIIQITTGIKTKDCRVRGDISRQRNCNSQERRNKSGHDSIKRPKTKICRMNVDFNLVFEYLKQN